MRVGELIEKLKEYDSQELVLVSGYEGDYESSITVSRKTVHKQVAPFFGDYQEWEDYDQETEPNEPFQPAVVVERNPGG